MTRPGWRGVTPVRGMQGGAQPRRPSCLLFCQALVRVRAQAASCLWDFRPGGSAVWSRAGTGKVSAALTFLTQRAASLGQNPGNGEPIHRHPTRSPSRRDGVTEEAGGELLRLPSLPPSLRKELPFSPFWPEDYLGPLTWPCVWCLCVDGGRMGAQAAWAGSGTPPWSPGSGQWSWVPG